MLSEVLKLMDQEQTLVITEISQKLGWTILKVENALDQLERMGFIQKKNLVFSACSSESCSGCSFKKENLCQKCQRPLESIYSWSITERGKDAL